MRLRKIKNKAYPQRRDEVGPGRLDGAMAFTHTSHEC
jgi:hypothetical protein